MTEERFEALVAERCQKVHETLAIKGREYRRENNPLHNFEVGARMEGSTPTRALQGMLAKHLISYYDMLNDIDAGKVPTAEYVNEKLGDIINYFILQEGNIKNLIEGNE